MGPVYGIDFGTSNSAIMVGRPDGRILRVRNPFEQSVDIPSAVCVLADRALAVGSLATRMKRSRAAWYRDEFKRDFGSSTPMLFPPEDLSDPSPGQSYEAHELAAEVLRVLRTEAEQVHPGTPEVVVIAVPASWQAGNRELMLTAAELAGFPRAVVRLVTEPEAAVAYAVQEHLGLEERTLLVYDLGGGTFDCALARGRTALDFAVLGEPGGLGDVGGVLFNRKILDVIRERYPDQVRQLLDGPARDIQTLARRLQLHDTCEDAKRVLSRQQRFDGLLTELSPDETFTLTRDELSRLLEPLLLDTVRECERLLTAHGLRWEDVDGIVPIGGSTRLPMVGELIARTSGRASVHRIDDPELAVAHGATMHAAKLRTASTPEPVHSSGELAARLDPPEVDATGRVLFVAPLEAPRLGPVSTEPPSVAELSVEVAPPKVKPAKVTPPAAASVEAKPAPIPLSWPPRPLTRGTFSARHAGKLKTFRAWNRISVGMICVAILTQIVQASSNWYDPILEMIVFYASGAFLTLIVVSVCVQRMEIGSGGFVAALVFLGGAMGCYNRLDGTAAGITVGILFALYALVHFGSTFADLARGTYLVSVAVGAQVMTFLFDDGERVAVEWGAVDVFFIRGEGLNRSLYARTRGPQLRRFVNDESLKGQKLFERHHFQDGDRLLDTIGAHSKQDLAW